MTEQPTLPLDIKERTEADRADRKTARMELSEELVATFEYSLERAWQDRREHPALELADYTRAAMRKVGEAEGRIEAYTEALGLAKSIARSTEEACRREGEISRRTPEEVEILHSRHIDDCPVCRDRNVTVARLSRERKRLEAARSAVVMFAHQLSDHPAKAGLLAKALIKRLNNALAHHD